MVNLAVNVTEQHRLAPLLQMLLVRESGSHAGSRVRQSYEANALAVWVLGLEVPHMEA